MTRIDQAELLATVRAYLDAARASRSQSRSQSQSQAQSRSQSLSRSQSPSTSALRAESNSNTQAPIPTASAAPAAQAACVPLPDTHVHASAAGQAEIRMALVQRVAALAMDDPQRRRKAFRLYLETVLTSEFGAALLADHDFDRFVEKILQRMESAPELAQAIEQAGALLLAE